MKPLQTLRWLAAGALAFVAFSLLVNPAVTGTRVAWGTFYGAF